MALLPVRPHHDVAHGSAFRVMLQRLCVYSVVMKSVGLTLCVFMLPVQLPPSCTSNDKLWTPGRRPVNGEGGSGQGGGTILYLWGEP